MNPQNLAVLASGSFLMCGLITGVWKYRQISASPEHQAHPYVDIAHRASLLYSFASLVLAEFASRSPLSTAITYACVTAPLVFFAVAVGSYIVHGWARDTDNQFRDQGPMTTWMMRCLIAAEVGGFGVLFTAVAWDMLQKA